MSTLRWGGEVLGFYIFHFDFPFYCSDDNDVTEDITDDKNYPASKLKTVDEPMVTDGDSSSDEKVKSGTKGQDAKEEEVKKDDENGKSSKDEKVESGANNTEKKKDDDIPKGQEDAEEPINEMFIMH